MKQLFFIAISLLLISSCEYNNLEVMYPIEEICDTTDVSYSNSIQALLTANCGTTTTCHQASGSLSEIPLVTYDDVMNVVATGQFLSSVTHDGNTALMPKGGSKLNDCSINTIKAWINQGTKE